MNQEKKSKKIYLINRSDAIGDTLLTLPLCEKIKSNDSAAYIIFLASHRVGDLLSRFPFIDEVWQLDRRHSKIYQLKWLYQKFKEQKIDHYFYVGGTHLASFLSYWLRVKFRGGLLSRLPSYLFLNKGVRQKRSFVSMHEVEYNLQLLTPLFSKEAIFSAINRPEYSLSDESIEQGLNFVKSLLMKEVKDEVQCQTLLHKNWFMIHPGMTGHTLNWPIEHYAKFIFDFLNLHRNDFLCLISYTASDEKIISALKQELEEFFPNHLPQELLFLNGQEIGLSTYAALLSRAKIFLGPSTGTTHLANLLNVPIVSIYSPIKAQSARRWGPFYRSENVRPLVPEVVCGENYRCAQEECPYYECMEKIDVSKVLMQVNEILVQESILQRTSHESN